MSTLFVNKIQEETPNNGVAIAGHVIQTVNGSITNETQSTTSNLVDTGLQLSITPKFNTSKIFISVSNMGIAYNTNYVRHKLLRGSTVICAAFAYNNNNYWMPVNFAMTFLDSPATTSSITYKTQFGASNNGDIRYNYSGDGTGSNASITLMEIAQ